MSMRALHSAATGMEAFMFELDVIANNLANAGTTGFKGSRAEFEDLFYQHYKVPGQQTSGSLTPTGISVGMGTALRATQVDFRSGNLEQTGRDLDVAIAGEGFFQVENPSGQPYYTRAGTFSRNADGILVVSSASTGRPLVGGITIPANALEISIGSGGVVSYREAGSPSLSQAGTIELARFVNPEGLLQIGENLYEATDASGSVTTGIPGLDGTGTLKQRFLETSNVEPVRELVGLIKTQRNVELNSEALKAGDQMLQLINNLRKF